MKRMRDGWQPATDDEFTALLVWRLNVMVARANTQRWLDTRRTNRRRPVLVATYRDDGAAWAEVEYEADRP